MNSRIQNHQDSTDISPGHCCAHTQTHDDHASGHEHSHGHEQAAAIEPLVQQSWPNGTRTAMRIMHPGNIKPGF